MSHALPETDWPETREFWAAASRHQLAIPRCAGCGRFVWYPRSQCPACACQDLPWETLSGRGSLFSWALVERALFAPFKTKAPYVTGLVALEEDPGVRIVTNIVDCDPQHLEIDMPVQVVFRTLEFADEAGRVVAPFFVPVREALG